MMMIEEGGRVDLPYNTLQERYLDLPQAGSHVYF